MSSLGVPGPRAAPLFLPEKPTPPQPPDDPRRDATQGGGELPGDRSRIEFRSLQTWTAGKSEQQQQLDLEQNLIDGVLGAAVSLAELVWAFRRDPSGYDTPADGPIPPPGPESDREQ